MLVRFLCLILLRMSCGRSLSVLRILPTGMCFFPVLYSMLVNVLFASCPFSDRVGLPLHNILFPRVLMKSIGAVFL